MTNGQPAGKLWVGSLIIGSVSLAVIALVLAGALAWGPQHYHCDLQFPKVIGCVLGSYEALSGSLIASSAALIAGWFAWKAVQRQIDAEDRRAAADRVEVERLLAADVDEFAQGLAAIWKVLDGLDWRGAPERPPDFGFSETPARPPEIAAKLEAVTYGIEKIAKESWISTSRRMAAVLGWDRRRRYEQLFAGLEELRKFRDLPDQSTALSALNTVRSLSLDFEFVRTETAKYFEGLFRRPAKAWPLGDYILHIARIED